MKKITVTIKGGAATVETSGFQGAECHKETSELERKLGSRTSDRTTPEYHQRQVTHVRQ